MNFYAEVAWDFVQALRLLTATLSSQEFPVARNITYIDVYSVGERVQALLLLNVSVAAISFLGLLVRFIFVEGAFVVQHAPWHGLNIVWFSKYDPPRAVGCYLARRYTTTGLTSCGTTLTSASTAIGIYMLVNLWSSDVDGGDVEGLVHQVSASKSSYEWAMRLA